MKNIKIGVVGLGMGSDHAQSIFNGEIEGAELTAVCDINEELIKNFPTVKGYTESTDFIRCGNVDAIIIATPHYFHTPIGIDALDQGLHVLVEKPLSVHKADCERFIAAHKYKNQVFAQVFQWRTDPGLIKVREVIRNGELGEIQRMNWIFTDWFRSNSYFTSRSWRGTWAGEGGGLLLNQCPHQLDIWQWLFGMPSKVRAFCQLGRYHNIEVEDDVTAYMEYNNGAHGIFISSSGEAPIIDRLEVHGDLGYLRLDDKILTIFRNKESTSENIKRSDSNSKLPPTVDNEISYDAKGGDPRVILQNFVDAIREGSDLVAPASEGIHAVELANAILYSSLTESTVELPLDGTAYEKQLKKLIHLSEDNRLTDQSP